MTEKQSLKPEQRVLCRVDRDEWYTGTIEAVAKNVVVLLDDGTRITAADSELRYIRRMRVNRRSPTALTLDQARFLYQNRTTSVLYDAEAEKLVVVDLKNDPDPWPVLFDLLQAATSLVAFNSLLSIESRNPDYELTLATNGPPLIHLTEQMLDQLLTTAGDAVERLALATGLRVQRRPLSLNISNAHTRIRLDLKISMYATNRSFLTITKK